MLVLISIQFTVDTQIVVLKEFFEINDFEKSQQTYDNESMKNYPACKSLMCCHEDELMTNQQKINVVLVIHCT